MTTLLGVLAACFTTGAWLPQLARTFRTRHARDLSWAYVLTFGTGVTLWVAYGVLQSDPVVLGANATSLALVGALSALKWTSDRRPAAPPG